MWHSIEDRVGVFAPQYYGSIYYYATLASYAKVAIDSSLRYDKRFKSVHRCDIADTRGALSLTVPVSRPADESIRQWRQMRVSPHAQWWHTHRISLESAYGRTPYFEFYIDRFLPWLRYDDVSVVDFDLALDKVIRRTLGIEAEIVYDISELDPILTDDWRNNRFDTAVHDVPYYQVRADKLGFIKGMSILDLIFNMGPEAPIVLKDMRSRP